MNDVGSEAQTRPTVTLVEISGDLDARSAATFAPRLAGAIASGRPVLVDLGDCTFVDGLGARLLGDAHRRATEAGVRLCVVLPFSAASPVRRMLLEFAPDLVSFPIVATRSAASGPSGRRIGADVWAAELERVHELRAGLWEAGRRREQLLADRDALLLTQRAALAAYRDSRAHRPPRD